MGEVEIVKLLNRAKDDFCEETEIYKKTTQQSTTANTRWYSIPTGITQIEEVYFDDVRIPRLQGNPIINDET
jgi:hypothetical protein